MKSVFTQSIPEATQVAEDPVFKFTDLLWATFWTLVLVGVLFFSIGVFEVK